MNVIFRGCRVGSRLANLWPQCHLASVFINASYMPPDPTPGVETRIKLAKEKYGFDLNSYWKFFAAEESPRLLSEHVRTTTLSYENP
jgi:soluble epoxide hydrolase / lipid-phosphate phosphatase